MDQKIAYGSASQGITITLASLAAAAARECTAIVNTSNLFLDALLYLAIKLSSGTIGDLSAIRVWFYASEDGTNYTSNATGSDAALTMASPTNLRGPFIIATPTQSLTYKAVIPVAQFFGGIMPAKWGIVVENRSNIAFDSTEGNHTKEYRGVYSTVV